MQAAPLQSGTAWWRCVIDAGLPPNAQPLLLLAHAAGDPAHAMGLLPLCAEPGGRLSSLSTPYTCLFQPLLAEAAEPHAVGRAFGRACGVWPVLRLDALDDTWPHWAALLAGFAASGWRAAWFDSFGNWHADASAGWDAYLAARPGALRETIRRKLRRAERDPALTFTLTRRPEDVPSAWAAYQSVYGRSWKEPEPFPEFGPRLVVAAASAGLLRMGVLSRDGTPLAAQYWTVEDGVATVHKLAHDETERALSPGTVLTAWMVRSLLAEGVTGLDFGRGDDPYKQLWTDLRRQRRGLILARPWRPRGAAALGVQALGRLRRTRAIQQITTLARKAALR